MSPDAIAIIDGPRATPYHELNQRANALARRLCASGLKRGSLALVQMPRSTDLAVVLLAVLKSGACYAWTGSSNQGGSPVPFAIQRGTTSDEHEYLALDIERTLRETATGAGPSLPILTRGSDLACVLTDENHRPNVLVPHATIAALPRIRAPRQIWEGTTGALDLWVALMSGTTLSVGITSPATAAA